ncbi:hypothetical protein DEM27_10580 [Metarhizobium album]|uniref:Uncharacterized protein n=1 Tax=Metarhizobium album TaxID=2182425 RepID=A0A2U2DUA0_9HYPH|nr:hypothetical protein [Rhizobium album]PWE56799.1 hypothetical protein DEM27_10580 [Rhizobium album]
MANTDDRYILSDEEVLLMFGTTRSGIIYVSESTNPGKSYTVDMLLDEPGDHCPRILALNTKTLVTIDVTETFAKAWLERADEADELEVDREITVDDLEAGFPDYVKNSRAWALLKDDIEASAPVLPDPDRAYDERRDRQAMGWM